MIDLWEMDLAIFIPSLIIGFLIGLLTIKIIYNRFNKK